MSELTRFDAWLKDEGPAALVIRDHLMPVEGHDGVIFPATFAKGDGFEGGYNIDPPDPAAEKNVCLVDTVGSQANRIEPMFAKERYAGLVPRVVVKAGDKQIDIVEAGHRAGDALVRCSALHQELQAGFKAVLNGNAEPLAKIAPTSLVFGVWDSRDTQAKLPRLIASTVRAFDVRRLRRSAQYNPSAEYVALGMLEAPADKAVKDLYAERGFIHVPATGTHGGVIARGGVRRDATLSLAALRLLAVREGAGGPPVTDRTQVLRRYVLGLALAAFTYSPTGYLRQGCNLVHDPDKPREFVEVHADGKRVPLKVTHDDAVAYAEAAAKAFGVGQARAVEFDKEKAKQDVAGDGEGKAKKGGKKGGK